MSNSRVLVQFRSRSNHSWKSCCFPLEFCDSEKSIITLISTYILMIFSNDHIFGNNISILKLHWTYIWDVNKCCSEEWMATLTVFTIDRLLLHNCRGPTTHMVVLSFHPTEPGGRWLIVRWVEYDKCLKYSHIIHMTHISIHISWECY